MTTMTLTRENISTQIETLRQYVLGLDTDTPIYLDIRIPHTYIHSEEYIAGRTSERLSVKDFIHSLDMSA
jgi:hypothetical protein